MKIKVLKTTIIIIVLFSLVSLITNIILYNVYTKKINNNILNIVGVVKEKYSNVSDEELLNILNNNSDNSYTLDEYGIYVDDIYMIENTKNIYKVLIISNLFIPFALGIILLSLLIYYIKKRKEKTNQITNYIKDINDKKYTLKLDENDEDELSHLQNELYKITVLLKEQSENAIIDKKNIKDALSDISHQLKTPLTSIIIGLDNIIDNKEMDEDIKYEFLLDIKKQTNSVNFLINSILILSRFDANVVKFIREEINVKKLINAVLKNIKYISKEKNIKIEIKGSNNTVFVGDYKWELEALTNILKNSVEHSHDNGKIRISYRNLSIYTEIIIEDNGKGIEKSDLRHIFERFYKGKNSSSDSIGIGLALSKKIIEQDNGYISVSSKINEGTKFVIKYIKDK